jgi:hypothetical protein
METRLLLEILPQPDDFSCGATCLHAIYRYYDDEIPLDTLIKTVQQLEEGGTLGVLLGTHALQRGYDATIYTYNLEVFDPTWFTRPRKDLVERLAAQKKVKEGKKLGVACDAYIAFLKLGGRIEFADLTANLIRRYLKRNIPVLAGLSSTYLYRSAREFGTEDDDIRGVPVGHFVVLCGYDRETRRVLVADPYLSDPAVQSHLYEVPIYHLVCSILLGILTYDANLVIIEPRAEGK